MPFSFVQRVVVFLMLAGVATSLGMGLWPLHADVYGKPSYSCGSGFIHSRHDWRTDSLLLRNVRLANDSATGTPAQLCPAIVYDRRDLALLVGGTSIVLGLLLLLLLPRRQPDRAARAALASLRLRRKSAG